MGISVAQRKRASQQRLTLFNVRLNLYENYASVPGAPASPDGRRDYSRNAKPALCQSRMSWAISLFMSQSVSL